MATLLYILAGTALAAFGAYRLGKWAPLLGSLVALALLAAAWLLIRQHLTAASLGDGAPSSAGVFIGLLVLVEFAAILLAGTLLFAGWKEHKHPLSSTLFLFLFLPLLLYAIYDAVPSAPPRPATAPDTTPRATRQDGYIWALDAQIMSAAECRNGNAEYLAGCREGVAKNRAALSR